MFGNLLVCVFFFPFFPIPQGICSFLVLVSFLGLGDLCINIRMWLGCLNLIFKFSTGRVFKHGTGSPQPWECSKNLWRWHRGHGSGMTTGWLMVGFGDLWFQAGRFCDVRNVWENAGICNVWDLMRTGCVLGNHNFLTEFQKNLQDNTRIFSIDFY